MNLLSIIAAEGPNGYWWPSDVKEFWWGLIAFSIVFLLMAWKLFPLIGRGLASAQAKAIDDASSSDKALEAARQDQAALRAELGDAESAGADLIAEARAQADTIRSEGMARNEQVVAELRARGDADIASMQGSAQADLSAELSSRTLGAAEAVVASNLDESTHGSLIEDYISKIGASS